MKRFLAINPGSTSTKIALYEGTGPCHGVTRNASRSRQASLHCAPPRSTASLMPPGTRTCMPWSGAVD